MNIMILCIVNLICKIDINNIDLVAAYTLHKLHYPVAYIIAYNTGHFDIVDSFLRIQFFLLQILFSALYH